MNQILLFIGESLAVIMLLLVMLVGLALVIVLKITKRS